MSNSIRITGSEEFVKSAGDVVVSLMVANYEIVDSGVKKSTYPKYKNYVRYIRVVKKKDEL